MKKSGKRKNELDHKDSNESADTIRKRSANNSNTEGFDSREKPGDGTEITFAGSEDKEDKTCKKGRVDEHLIVGDDSKRTKEEEEEWDGAYASVGYKHNEGIGEQRGIIITGKLKPHLLCDHHIHEELLVLGHLEYHCLGVHLTHSSTDEGIHQLLHLHFFRILKLPRLLANTRLHKIPTNMKCRQICKADTRVKWREI